MKIYNIWGWLSGYETVCCRILLPARRPLGNRFYKFFITPCYCVDGTSSCITFGPPWFQTKEQKGIIKKCCGLKCSHYELYLKWVSRQHLSFTSFQCCKYVYRCGEIKRTWFLHRKCTHVSFLRLVFKFVRIILVLRKPLVYKYVKRVKLSYINYLDMLFLKEDAMHKNRWHRPIINRINN